MLVGKLFIDAAEATRLDVQSGWYCSKATETFVTGPHETRSVASGRWPRKKK
jgi:hypothetical protein